MKCKNCGTDISSDLAKEVSDAVIRNIPNSQPEVQVKEKIVPKYPPEMKLVWCDDCHTHHNNPSYRKPTQECRDCGSPLDSSRDRCVFCGSEDVKDEDDW